MTFLHTIVVLCVVSLVHQSLALEFDDIELKKYNVSNYLTISGLSSCGFMSIQMHVAYSSILKGVAAFGAGPYYCSQNNETVMHQDCDIFTRDGPNTELLIELTKQFESEGKIDPTSNLYDDQSFVWMGKFDTVIGTKVTKSTEDYYRNFVDNSRLHLDHTFPAQHCLPTLDYGEECTKLRPPFIGNCGYDGAGEALKHLFGSENLQLPVDVIEGNLYQFDQTPYIPKPIRASSLNEKGFIYVPTACQSVNEQCFLHISLHGCLQSEEIIGDKWAVHGGYNRWAESNNIIVLYPNAKISVGEPANPGGCWDIWGYTGADYAFKTGLQMKFIRDMIRKLSGI